MQALLDGDIIAYRSAASCEPTRAKPDREPLEAAIGRAEDLVRRILYETNSDHYRLFIGGETNFRYSIDANYKANRKDVPRPMYLQDVRAYLVTEWKAEITDGIEADDMMGILQTEDTIISTIDKDLDQVAGWHHNFVKGTKYFVEELDGLRFFYQQLIQGDSSDNIMGYDGKARPKLPKFLQPCIDNIWQCVHEPNMYEIVLDMYQNEKERLIRNARLLWIQRYEGDIWSPPDERDSPAPTLSTAVN